MKKQLLTFLALFISGLISAQVGIGTTDPKSSLEIQGSLGYKVTSITSATTLDDTYNVVLCNNAPYTVTLPPAAASAGRVYRIKNIDPSGDAITIDGNGAETIDGELTYLLQPYKHSITLISNGANWYVVEAYNDGNYVAGAIESINCSGTDNGTLVNGVAASGVNSVLSYTGGNAGTHSGQTVTSTTVTGLTATLNADTFASGEGSLTYTITGTPSGTGTASFAVNIGGKTCTLTRTVVACGHSVTFTYKGASVTYGTVTGANSTCWLDRNLGASQVATSSADVASYGDLYQWGRGADGHQIRTSSTTTTLSSSDNPGHGDFITLNSTPNDWRSPQNANLWQGVNGVNNPCPSGYRLPTEAELDAERQSWFPGTSAGAFASPLKLPMAGFRNNSNGAIGPSGTYWSSTVSSTNSRYLDFTGNSAGMNNRNRASGGSVRCLKD